MEKQNEQRSAFIAVVGRPNVGKSSLLNKIIGQKIAIVSSKPQTTRTRIMGVLNRDNDQIIYIDTPGFHKPKNKLGEKMMTAVSTGLSDVEAVTLVVEAKPNFKLNPDDMPKAEVALIEEIKKRNLKTILAVNKIDLVGDKTDLLLTISAYKNLYDFEAVVPVSAVSGDGIEELIAEQMKFLRPSPHFFDADQTTDQADSIMVTELIREKILRLLDKEIPHGTAVGLERFFERDTVSGEPIIETEAIIYCEKESHKGIIIGKGGSMLKRIGTESRADIEKFFGCKCNLKLWVKVKEDWRNRDGLIRSFGLSEK
jgi:GTP-binding protein Era